MRATMILMATTTVAISALGPGPAALLLGAGCGAVLMRPRT